MDAPALTTTSDLPHILSVNWKIEVDGNTTMLIRKDLFNMSIIIHWDQKAVIFADRYGRGLSQKLSAQAGNLSSLKLLEIENEAIRHIQRPIRGHPGLNSLFKSMDELRRHDSAPGSVYALRYRISDNRWGENFALIEINRALQTYFAKAVQSYQSAQRMFDRFGLQKAKNKISLVVKPTWVYQDIQHLGEFKKNQGFCWNHNQDQESVFGQGLKSRIFNCQQNGCEFSTREHWNLNDYASYMEASQRVWQSHQAARPGCHAIIDY